MVRPHYPHIFRLLVIMLCSAFLAGCVEEGNPFFTNDDSLDSQDESGTSPEENAATNTATLSWTPPGSRVNGESLPDGYIDSFIISYGQDENNLEHEVMVPYTGSRNMEYVIEDLGEGAWYFGVQTVDTGDLISPMSEIVSKEI